MTPVEILIDETFLGDEITGYTYVLKIFGVVVFRRMCKRTLDQQQNQRTTGFNVFPDMRQIVDDPEE